MLCLKRIFSAFQNRGELIILRYSNRWAHEMFRKCLQVSSTDPGRHMMKNYCPCQYIESHLKCKPQGEILSSMILTKLVNLMLIFYFRRFLFLFFTIVITQLYVSILICAIKYFSVYFGDFNSLSRFRFSSISVCNPLLRCCNSS